MRISEITKNTPLSASQDVSEDWKGALGKLAIAGAIGAGAAGGLALKHAASKWGSPDEPDRAGQTA